MFSPCNLTLALLATFFHSDILSSAKHSGISFKIFHLHLNSAFFHPDIVSSGNHSSISSKIIHLHLNFAFSHSDIISSTNKPLRRFVQDLSPPSPRRVFHSEIASSTNHSGISSNIIDLHLNPAFYPSEKVSSTDRSGVSSKIFHFHLNSAWSHCRHHGFFANLLRQG